MFGFSLKNVLCFILGAFILSFAGKDIYLPRFFSQQGIDFESASAKWSRTRMDSTENWIILWESGFGNDPSTAPSPFKVNMKQLKEVLEKSYDVNLDRKSTRLNSSHVRISYAVFCLKKKKKINMPVIRTLPPTQYS